MKRLTAPKFWPIEKKTKKFVLEPKPGPHPKHRCFTLGIVLRDLLGHAHTMKEAKKMLKSGHVLVDNKQRKETAFPVGLMDIIHVGSESYRIVPGNKNLMLKKIDENDAKIKLLEIKNKKIIGSRTQLNLHDGSNIISSEKCKTGDVIVYDIEKKEIKEIFPMEKGSSVIITSGHNTGKTGKIEKIIITKGSQMNYVVVEIDGKKKLLPKNYAFVIGRERPAIEL
ncbi:MAG TPA: 30S ribosomal protein S4e [archaeon]|nr:30S ribosomal protein S4e [archaeon]